MFRKIVRALIPFELRSKIKASIKSAEAKLKLFARIETRLLIEHWRDIPVIINNRNRHTYLLMLIDWLEKVGVRNIYILDNDSTYPPLLKYYSETKHTILFLRRNIGKTALWESEHYQKVFRHNYFIYTDPDVVPTSFCPNDAISFLWKKLKEYEAETEKVGFGIRIDNLPDHFNLKNQVIKWEQHYWTNTVDDDLFVAAIDTTFALYRPYAPHNEYAGYRTGEPYLLEHLPWYLDYDNLSDEEQFYLNHAVLSSTTARSINEKTDYLRR